MQSLSPNQIRRIINEERIIAEQVFIVEKTLQAEARRLQLEGYSPSEINEGIMDFLGKIAGGIGGVFKNLPGGVKDTIVNKVVRWFAGKVGMNPDGLAAKALGNVFEEIEISNLSFYFSAEGCDDLAEKLIQALGETLADEGIDKLIVDVLGITDDPNGLIYQTLRESLTNMLGQTDWAMGGKAQLADAICSMGGEMGSVLAGLPVVGGLFGGDKDGEKPPAAPEEEPEPV